MQFSRDELMELINDVNMGAEISSRKIPEIDLYMDQVIQLFENNLNSTKRNETDKILTKTMINNYSKEKILFPTKNKKYSKEHIILMILTYDLKQILSIGDIKRIFTPMVNDVISEDNKVDIVDIYDKYIKLKEKQKEEEESFINKIIGEVDEISAENEDEYKKLLLILLATVNSSNLNKRITEKIIDKYF